MKLISTSKILITESFYSSEQDNIYPLRISKIDFIKRNVFVDGELIYQARFKTGYNTNDNLDIFLRNLSKQVRDNSANISKNSSNSLCLFCKGWFKIFKKSNTGI